MRRKIAGGPAAAAKDHAPMHKTAKLPSQALAWARAHPWLVYTPIAGLALLGVIGFSLFLGFQANRYQAEPVYTLFDKVDRKLKDTFFRIPAKLEDRTIGSTLINLDASIAVVDVGRTGEGGPMGEAGGGLTQVGDELLLLAYNGRIYSAHDADTVVATNIVGPENNRAAFIALKNDAQLMRTHTFDFTYLRYNDLQAYDTGSERGLIASYTEYHPAEKCYTNTLAVLPFPAGATSIAQISAKASDWRVLFRAQPCLPFKADGYAMEGQMAGGKLAFAAPSTIYLSSGDYHFDGMRSEGEPTSQDPKSQYGKMLKIELATGAAQILSTGHRNPQGITILKDGTLMSVEHGPQGGDELNVIKPGANYGWPLESYGITYHGGPLPMGRGFGHHDSTEQPVMAWIPSVTPSAMIEVNGFDPAWEGDLLVGTLTDMSLQRIRMRQGRVVYTERIAVGSRIRDLHQMPDGRIVLWTDNEELIFLKSAPRVDATAEITAFVAEAEIDGATAERLKSVIGNCVTCHSFSGTEHARSPALGRIYSADIASTPYPGYSPALQDKAGAWTRENLIAFLQDPQAFAPGTHMPKPAIPDDRTLHALVGYLEETRKRF